MIRQPTSRAETFAWWLCAIAGGDPETTEAPECGWFKRKLVKHGPFVPAKIWLVQDIDDDGELTAPEFLQCEINGAFADPKDAWLWLCGNPISEAEFNYMEARRQYAVFHATHEPAANPRQPVDWLHGVPTPTFTTGERRP